MSDMSQLFDSPRLQSAESRKHHLEMGGKVMQIYHAIMLALTVVLKEKTGLKIHSSEERYKECNDLQWKWDDPEDLGQGASWVISFYTEGLSDDHYNFVMKKVSDLAKELFGGRWYWEVTAGFPHPTGEVYWDFVLRDRMANLLDEKFNFGDSE